jgi:hypothetical protein
MEINFGSALVRQTLLGFNPDDKTIIDLAEDWVGVLMVGFKKTYRDSYEKKMFIENYLNGLFTDQILNSRRDNYFKAGYLLAVNGKNPSFNTYVTAICANRYGIDIISDFASYPEIDHNEFIRKFADSIGHVLNMKSGASLCILISEVRNFAKEEDIEIEFAVPKNFLNDLRTDIFQNEVSAFENVKPASINYHGLPEFLYDSLPHDIQQNLKFDSYSPESIWKEVIAYFAEISMEDFAKEDMQKWSTKFEENIEKSHDKLTFIDNQKLIHDYKITNWEYAQDFQRIEKVGFDWAIAGDCKSIGNMLASNKIKHHLSKSYQHKHIDTSSYEDLMERLRILNLFTTGYAHAMFLNKINGYYTATYINTETQSLLPNRISNENTRISKLNWKGTPAEFGAIVSALIEKGYLEGYSKTSATCKVMKQVFDIRKADGEEVADRTLEDYFGRNKKTFTPVSSFQIPYSDNYSKD